MSSRKIIDLRNAKPRGISARQDRLPLRHSDTYERPKSALRVRRRYRRVVVALCVVCLIGASAWGVSYLSYLPRFSLQKIEVTGAQTISPAIIRDLAETKINDGSLPFISRDNIFFYPQQEITRAVASFPRIASAKVSRASLLAQAVTVAIVERSPYAQWCDDTMSCYVIDKTGFIFAAAASSTQTAEPYVFFGMIAEASSSPIGQTYASGQFPGLAVLLDRLGQAGFMATEIHQDNSQDVSITLASGFALRVSFGQDADTIVHNLQLILQSDPLKGKESAIDYIDLRFGDRVFYQMKGGERISTDAHS